MTPNLYAAFRLTLARVVVGSSFDLLGNCLTNSLKGS
ncbi:hypothetical protein AXFE_29480 [Acidithrix ferrooxidans]|uniref:Uncharacterized protein n=1 Tax=Acidithrix ferrooxidans TaxID=1280514 RepID=A0A0D8HE56_9ACTN|nr:hypothetical protein AXFE_29480 [Acidithrix ferrooxidans]